jgi:predicted nucleic acid-binding protein
VKVLIDTPIWSLALRRRGRLDTPAVLTLRRLINEGRAAIVGPIRQELLSGLREQTSFDRLRAHLAAFPDEPIARADYERATQYFNTCRAKGVQGSNTDFLLCAIAERHRMPIFTLDADFTRYARLIPVTLYDA